MSNERCPHCNSTAPPMMFWNQLYGLWSSMASSMMQSFMSPPGHAHCEEGWGRDYNPDEASSHPCHDSHHHEAHHGHHHEPQREPQPEPRHGVLKVLIQSNSDRNLDVDVDIAPGSDLASLTVMPLHALDNPTGHALTGTITRVGEHTIRLQLVVAPEQPKGTYVGALYDRAWKEVRGNVRVDLND